MFLSLLSLSFVVSGKTCPKHKCDDDLAECGEISDGYAYSNKDYCDEDEQCVMYSGTQAECIDLYEDQSLPGSKCSKNSQCNTESCLDNICDGIKKGKSCSSSLKCDIGLYCNEANGVCTDLKSAGEECESTDECDYQYLCYKDVCTKYYSIETGKSISSKACSGSYSDVCESGQCYEDDSDTICIDAYEYDVDIVSCESDSDCIGKSGDYSFKYECECGINSKGSSYCEITLGSTYGKKYLEGVKRILKTDTLKKSHKSETKLKIVKDWYSDEDFETYIEYEYGELIYDGLECAMDNWLKVIYYKEENDDEMSLGSMMELGLAFLAFI